MLTAHSSTAPARYGSQAATCTSAAKAAAFGLALQELTFETSGAYSLATGSFARVQSNAFSGQAMSDANALIAGVMAAPDAAEHMKLITFSSPSSQDLMAAVPAVPLVIIGVEP